MLTGKASSLPKDGAFQMSSLHLGKFQPYSQILENLMEILLVTEKKSFAPWTFEIKGFIPLKLIQNFSLAMFTLCCKISLS